MATPLEGHEFVHASACRKLRRSRSDPHREGCAQASRLRLFCTHLAPRLVPTLLHSLDCGPPFLLSGSDSLSCGHTQDWPTALQPFRARSRCNRAAYSGSLTVILHIGSSSIASSPSASRSYTKINIISRRPTDRSKILAIVSMRCMGLVLCSPGPHG